MLLDRYRRVNRREQGLGRPSRALRGCRDGARRSRWNDANVLALSLRTTSPAVLGEILDGWFEAGPGPDGEDAANIRHVDEIG